MKKLSLILIIMLMQVFAFGQNPNGWDTAWVHSFGGPSVDIGKDIKETSDKGFIIAATSSTFGSGNTSFYIIKTDSLGNHEWSQTIGTNNNDIANSVEIANDGGYLFSGISNWNINTGYDGYAVKTDNAGNVQWTKNYGWDDWDFVYNSCKMPDGGYLFCGETYSNTNGGADGLIIRTDVNGDTIWTKKIGGIGDDAFYSIEQANNRIFVVGKKYNQINAKSDASIYKLDFNGNILLSDFFLDNTLDDNLYNDLYINSNGSISVGGTHKSSTASHPLLRKIDSTNFVQLIYITSTQDFPYRCVIEGNNNDVYTMSPSIGGLGGLSALYIRFDVGLNYLHSANFGGTKDDDGYEIIRTTRGFAFIGSTKSYGNQNTNGAENVYLVVFNKNDLVNDYYIKLNEFQDTLSYVAIKETQNIFEKTQVFPNPTNSNASILFSNADIENKNVQYELYDALGRLVDQENQIVQNRKLNISKKDIQSGIYFYKIKLNSVIISTGKITFE